MSCIISPFLSVPTIALSVVQGKSDVKSASGDHLLGHIILDLKAPMDILQITVALSGLSISRLDGTRHSQAHRVSSRI